VAWKREKMNRCSVTREPKERHRKQNGVWRSEGRGREVVEGNSMFDEETWRRGSLAIAVESHHGEKA